jgi:AsmA-like C-terminal region
LISKEGGRPMSLQSRAQKFLFWSTALMVLALAGGLWFAYTYVTDSDTLAAVIREQAPHYLPGSRLEVGRVRVRPMVGDLILHQVALWQKLDGSDYLALRIPWLDVRHDTAALLNGELRPREVVVAQPVLRLCRRHDGTWNVEGLLANPWPRVATSYTPLVVIQNGTVLLCDGDRPDVAILRDLSLRLEPTAEGPIGFEGSAKGDAFDRLKLKGTVDRATGRVTISEGELTRLVISDTLRSRLPAELRPMIDRVGLSSGEIDLSLKDMTYDPAEAVPIHYTASVQLRAGTLSCPELPFPLNDVTASLAVSDGVLTVEWAVGHNGKTTVWARTGGSVDLNDPLRGPMNLTLDVIDLEFDKRLSAWTPPEFVALWDEYRPQGLISLALSVRRDEVDGPLGFGMGVNCKDVALQYHEFPYPLDHLHGNLKWEANQITFDLQTLIGNKPANCKGTIDNPGPNAIVTLDFSAEMLPIDKTLFDAMPPDVRAVVNQFQPTGSVRGKAHVTRRPPKRVGEDEDVKIDAYIDLNERCSIKWDGLPYAITNLRGKLELHPNHWVFQNMRGSNGLASISGDGKVWQMGPNQLKTDLYIRGEHLPFDEQLRRALPKEWQATWAILRPSGSSKVAAQIQVEPGQEHYQVVIVPEPETRVALKLPRVPGPGVAPGETFDMPPMERISGTFFFDNGAVTMTDVSFQFRGSPAHFATGKVTVKDSGQFNLDVKYLEVNDFRIDAGLRQIMPPVMAQFARRLDDGKTIRFRTDLGIGWSGLPGQPAWCKWEKGLVVFNGNSIQTGLPLEHLQGQVDNLRGSYNGQDLEVHGLVNLDSVTLLGQQVTQVRSPVDVALDRATLSDVQASLLGGDVTGKVEVSLDDTPKYAAALALRGADLQRYTKTLPGRQMLRGLVAGQIVLNGLGNDVRTLQGEGEVHITRGDLGELPAYLRLVNILNLSPLTKTAFDSADAVFRIQHGETVFNPIKLTGNAISLYGSGTLSAQGQLNLGLRVLYGRDEGLLHIPIFSDALREASGQIFQIRVTGSPSYPRFHPVAVQQITDAVRTLGSRRAPRNGP